MVEWKSEMPSQERQAIGSKVKSERGSVLIEASLTIPVFMFVILALLLVLIPCIGQAKIANAMNEAAFDFSQNYYLRSTPGSEFLLGAIDDFAGALGGGSSPSPNQETWKVSTSQPVRETEEIAAKLVPKHIIGNDGTNSMSSVDAVLRQYGVVNGLSGLDFSLSGYDSKTNTMTFIVEYTIEMPPWPLLDMVKHAANFQFHTSKASTTTLWSRV